MPDELTDELIRLREKDRDTTRQLGELAKVTGIQNNKSGVIKIFVKQVVVNTKNIAGDSLIWGNSTFGIWGTDKWGSVAQAGFVLGNSFAGVIGTSKLGTQSSAWEEYYNSGDLEV